MGAEAGGLSRLDDCLKRPEHSRSATHVPLHVRRAGLEVQTTAVKDDPLSNQAEGRADRIGRSVLEDHHARRVDAGAADGVDGVEAGVEELLADDRGDGDARDLADRGDGRALDLAGVDLLRGRVSQSLRTAERRCHLLPELHEGRARSRAHHQGLGERRAALSGLAGVGGQRSSHAQGGRRRVLLLLHQQQDRRGAARSRQARGVQAVRGSVALRGRDVAAHAVRERHQHELLDAAGAPDDRRARGARLEGGAREVGGENTRRLTQRLRQLDGLERRDGPDDEEAVGAGEQRLEVLGIRDLGVRHAAGQVCARARPERERPARSHTSST